jgi:acyl-CoA thioesterase FadM
MERIKVSLPDSFSFSTRIDIRITDLNYGGHVGNDSFLSLVHEARQQFLKRFGYSELSIEGAALIMADSAIEYKRELSYGDVIKISVAAGAFDRLGFDLYYLLEVSSEGIWLTAGKVKTGMLCFDYTTRKKVPVPAKAIEKMNAG